MLLSQIEYFQAVVETGNFTKAAEKCHVSQSAISQQIKAMEDELGVLLLDRHNRTFTVTPAGETFYKKTVVWISDLKQICHDTVRVGKNDEAVLNIGYLSCYGGNEFQNATAQFAEKYPDVKVQIINGNHEDLYHAIRNEEVDIILSDQRRAFNEAYVNLELVMSRCYVQIAASNPLSKLDSIEINDLKNTPCILVSSKEQQDTERAYYQNEVGFKGDILFAGSLQEARIMVAAGRGVMPIEGIRPSDNYDKTVKMIALMKNGQQVRRKYCAFWSKENSGYYVEEFADMLKEQFDQEIQDTDD